ncbi:hypothetical protein SETIT_9G063500v2 [Setaria italica]|uniref:Uncharacterized protein n=2 Tax=Setaria TaxID=4554 RepID=A0A368SFG9_SETIT|nr:hypothetical protein SETIT_9G063500v2 [Setaria italica]TKV90955.1 hypothetical protein SEVIR_9G062800v2 [Setaria viridis]
MTSWKQMAEWWGRSSGSRRHARTCRGTGRDGTSATGRPPRAPPPQAPHRVPWIGASIPWSAVPSAERRGWLPVAATTSDSVGVQISCRCWSRTRALPWVLERSCPPVLRFIPRT